MKERGMEGMIFGAAILAVGVGYLVYKKTGDPMMGIMIGAGVGLIDVIILRYVAILTDKNKKK